MKIYIDADYKCHSQDAETFREFNVVFFDGKCPTFINGYRYVPQGETWVDERGTEFHGEMVAPWVDYRILAEAQKNYEDGQNDILSFVEQQLGVLQ